MWHVHGLIIVVTRLPLQVHIQACINASKVVYACILFSSTWLPFYEASSAPLGTHVSSPDVHPPMHMRTHAEGGASMWNFLTMDAHFYSSLVCTALLQYHCKGHNITATVNNRQFMVQTSRARSRAHTLRLLCHLYLLMWLPTSKVYT